MFPPTTGDQEANVMSVSTPRAKPVPPAEPTDVNGAIPPLKAGDRLTRDEFERRLMRCRISESRADRRSRLLAFTGQTAKTRGTAF